MGAHGAPNGVWGYRDGMTEVEDLGAELADFRRRVAELRASRSLPSSERSPALDAALIELQHAADVLWPRYERLAHHLGGNGRRGDGHEQQLLRALFQRLPVPTMLLDRDTVVRRLNVAATQLFGMRAGYATGRSLATSLAREGRAAFRSQVAAVARGEGERSLVVHLLRPPEVSAKDGGELRATLTALRPPREPRAAVLAVFQRAIAGPPAPAAPGAPPGPHTAPPDLAEVSRHTRVLDLVDEMATALLQIPLDSPDTPGEDRVATVAERTARVLGASFADWTILDVAEGETVRRVHVDGPDALLRKAVAAQPPMRSPLVADAVRHGTESVRVRPEDPEALGRDATGAQVLLRAEVSSLLCLPLVVPRGPEEGRVLGALTLLRTGGRRPFELAETAAAARMARHVTIALHRLLRQHDG